ncbi:winged helix-turn-helix domain-containing protein [Kitasatospora sp. NBC_01287]|uniref:AfsR/SARP family transcriptional regulator n=1 Tax=Kitasatospora sp. NBC_01287 TaxID=2903573 RepID=UPI002250EACD|nr:BTAD domain-containing putative transcriptional regulator [Kitasatospora sp. NBC_01287]MCX4746856.1 winged helix-turn-helix domain-containing protein [Kitasatospora sp. NBC_01287]
MVARAGAGGMLRYELLGPLVVHRAGVVRDPGPAMQCAVLAVLLLSANEPVPRGQIVQAVWGARATVNSPGLVATYVSRLRRILEPDRPRRAAGTVLTSHGAGYRLALGPGELDLHEFEAARQRARARRAAGRPAEAAGALDEALALWRGGGLDGLPGPFAALHRGRLAELRLAAQEERFELALLLGRQHEVVAELGLLAAAHPRRERLRGLLMLALYRAGRQSEALAVFAETRQSLISSQGLEPGRELEELQQRILRADPGLDLEPALDRPGAPALATRLREVCRPAQLPSDLADFTGRSAEARLLARTLGAGGVGRRTGAVPVAVISGPPGVGKTALAVHVAQRLRERFPDGQLYAGLHEADGRPGEARALLGRLLVDLGVAPEALPAEAERRGALFRSVIAGRRLLLVLDDAGDEGQVAALLPGSPSCAVLVTARGRLAGLPQGRGAALDCLGGGDARRLWRRLVGEPDAGEPHTGEGGAGEGDGEAALLAACAGLPLALRVAAARLLARPGRRLGALAARLADEERRLGELSPSGGGVAQALGTAWARLRREPDGLAAGAALRLLAALDPAGFDGPAAARLLGRPEPRVEPLLDLLAEHGLLLATPDGCYRMHPLTALLCRSPRWTVDGIRMPPGAPRSGPHPR